MGCLCCKDDDIYPTRHNTERNKALGKLKYNDRYIIERTRKQTEGDDIIKDKIATPLMNDFQPCENEVNLNRFDDYDRCPTPIISLSSQNNRSFDNVSWSGYHLMENSTVLTPYYNPPAVYNPPQPSYIPPSVYNPF